MLWASKLEDPKRVKQIRPELTGYSPKDVDTAAYGYDNYGKSPLCIDAFEIFKDSLIGEVINCNFVDIPQLMPPEKEPAELKDVGEIDLTKLQAILDTHFNKDMFTIDKTDGPFVILKASSAYRHHICELCNTTHQHENPYVFLYKKHQGVYWHCRRQKEKKGIPIGCLKPEELEPTIKFSVFERAKRRKLDKEGIEASLNKLIETNKRKYPLLTFDKTYSANKIRPLPDNYNTIIIKSTLGTCKSVEGTAFLKRHQDKSILAFTYRRSLAASQKAKLEASGIEITSYMDRKTLKLSKNGLVQVESTHLLDRTYQESIS